MDEDLKNQAEELFAALGFNLSTAITMFVKKSLSEQGIPFAVSRRQPNAITLAALEEAQHLKENPSLGNTYHSVHSMMEDLLK